MKFDQCDLEKEVKSKTRILCHVSLLDVNNIYDKNVELIQTLVQES
jgi:hypothetical protein